MPLKKHPRRERRATQQMPGMVPTTEVLFKTGLPKTRRQPSVKPHEEPPCNSQAPMPDSAQNLSDKTFYGERRPRPYMISSTGRGTDTKSEGEAQEGDA
jgi:hypothetical protein